MMAVDNSSHELSGRYRFIAEAGHGGVSEVYLTVTQGGLGGFEKLVVVKLLRRELADDEASLRMFLDEARLTARLNHPSVVQTYDVGEDRGRYYLAMEYLEGQTFEHVRRARNASKLFPLSMQLQMLVQVLSGLHYAHELVDYDNTPMSIVHRDVTPGNIFITYDGQVKVVDFGISGMTKGKARYVAPEQLAGSAVDRRADVFSVGVLLWEILAGKRIWSGMPEAEVVRRVTGGEIPSPPPEAPSMLQQICTSAMALHPNDRYPTAEALGADLELFLAQFTTPSRERQIGAAVTELFSDERARIRQLIEGQLKGSRPQGSGSRPLPVLRDAQVRQSGSSPYDLSHGSDPLDVPASGQITYAGNPVQNPIDPVRRKRALVVGSIAAAAVVAILGVVALTRGLGGAPATAEASRPGTVAAAAAASTPPPAPERPAPDVRGVTDDTITLGMSAAFSGPSRELGGRMKLGLETAFAAINDAGGIAGRTVKLLALDDGYEGKRARANVQELISDRNVFAIIGNVGTPTTKEALPYVVANRVVFFGAFTGAGLLRGDPPDRYVFNYRASYEEETAKMISYLLDVKKLPDRGIVVFAQNDSYGDAGYEGATKTLRKRGRSDEVLRVGYERNTVDVDDAVAKVLEYHNTLYRVGGDIAGAKHPVKAIIMVGTYKACARFIQKIRDKKIATMFLNVSFVGSGSLAEELRELGPGYAGGVIVTQVVPHHESGATGIIRYRDHLKKYHPDQQPDFVSLEGYVVGQLFAEGLRRAGRNLDTETLIDALEGIKGFEPGTGGSLSFGISEHQASHKVWGTQLDEHGMFRSIDME